MSREIRDENLEKLFEAILSLENTDECYALFSDLCTVNELLALKQRYWVARLLKQGLTYNEIVEKTGAAPATITRINKCLNYGDGYAAVLNRTETEGEKS